MWEWWHETSWKWLLFCPLTFSFFLYSDLFLSFDLSRRTLCLPLGWQHWLYIFPSLGSHTPTTQSSAITRPVSLRRMEVCVVCVWVCEGVHCTKHILIVFCLVYCSCFVYSSFVSGVILLWNPQQSWEEPSIYQITPHRIVQSAFLPSGRWGSLIVRSSCPSVGVLEVLLVSFYNVNRLSFALFSSPLLVSHQTNSLQDLGKSLRNSLVYHIKTHNGSLTCLC